MKNTTIALMLVLFITSIVLFEPTVLAADNVNEIKTYGEWEYIINGDNVTIDKYIGDKGEVIIPNEINNYQVTKIGTGGNIFENPESITQIIIPNSVKIIEENAFRECNIAEITIPNSVTEIGNCAFYECKSLKEVIIPDSVTSELSHTFQACTNLEYVKLSKNMKKIGEWAFDNCIVLSTLEIPNGVTSINEGAFECSGISDISIPETVETIEIDAFYACKNLKRIKIPRSVTSIGKSSFDFSELNEIYGYKNTYAEIYAGDHGIKFVALSEENLETIRSNEGAFTCVDKEFSGEKGYKYNDNYFDGDATTYNHHLATMSLCLAYSAYNSNPNPYKADSSYSNNQVDRNVRVLLTNCGFSNYKAYNYDVKPTMDNVACAIASKKLESGDTLIAIAVRGGGYEKEWGSNFTVGDVGDHDGFETAANIVYGRLIQYIKDNCINGNEIKGNIKIWVTGFSRAGATSNLFAAKLSEGGAAKQLSKRLIYSVSFDNADIYAYCFATPAGADTSDNSKPNDNIYRNIFNIVHYYDLVPLVAPAYWNFDRYGSTKIFLYKGDSKEAIQYENNMLKRLSAKEKSDYHALQNVLDGSISGMLGKGSMGHLLRSIIKKAKYIPLDWNPTIPSFTRDGVVRLGMQDYIRDKVEEAYNESNPKMSDQILDIIKESVIYNNQGLIGKEVYESVMNDLDEIKDYFVLVHADANYYLSWMQSMDSNYVKGATPTFTDGTGRLLKINCPVDVYVYDSSNNLVGTIINENLESEILSMYIDENEQKIVCLPKDEDYKITVIAREDCEIAVAIDEYEGVSSTTSRIIYYPEIKMNKSEEIIATATKFAETSNNTIEESGANYVLEKSGEEINPDANISKNQVTDYSYIVTTEYDENQGTVSGGGEFTLGDFCKLTAHCKSGYLFEGWFINNNKVSNEQTYRFAVEENVKIEARFKENFILGDINGDGKVNGKDWNRMYEYINETAELNGEELTRGDVNNDGKVNGKDWNRLYEHITEVNPLF